MLERNFRHLANHIFRSIESCAVRKLRKRSKVAFVLRRHKTRWNARKPDCRHCNKYAIDHERNPAGTHRVRNEFSVAFRSPPEKAIEYFEEPAEHKIDGAG